MHEVDRLSMLECSVVHVVVSIKKLFLLIWSRFLVSLSSVWRSVRILVGFYIFCVWGCWNSTKVNNSKVISTSKFCSSFLFLWGLLKMLDESVGFLTWVIFNPVKLILVQEWRFELTPSDLSFFENPCLACTNWESIILFRVSLNKFTKVCVLLRKSLSHKRAP